MSVPLVRIVNSNGRVGRVASTFPPLARGDLRIAPSQAAALKPGEDTTGLPARNASHASWVEFATDHGLSSDEAAGMTRDELVAHFTTAQEG